MVAPKQPGYRASLRGEESQLEDGFSAPPLSAAEELRCATEYARARAELRFAALESPLAAESFLALREPDAGDPDDTINAHFSRAEDLTLMRQVCRPLVKLESERRAQLRRPRKGARVPKRFANHSKDLMSSTRRMLERLDPTPEFVEYVLGRQREVLRAALDEQPLLQRLLLREQFPLGDVSSAVQAWRGQAELPNAMSRCLSSTGTQFEEALERLEVELSLARRRAWERTVDLDELVANHERAERARQTGGAARDRMVKHNLRLVVWVAKRYVGRGMPLCDLIQEGNFGLLRAVEKYDAARGFRFSTYATWWVRQAIQRGLADKLRTIRMPVHVHEMRRGVERTRRELRQSLGREPSLEEVARSASVTSRKLERIRMVEADPASLDAPLVGSGGSNVSLLGRVADETAASAVDQVAERQRLECLSVLLRVVSQRERFVLTRRFGLSGEPQRTLQQIADELDVTRERVRQIQVKAMEKLARAARRRGLVFDDL